jgi:cytochrome c-type biogenesis protein CcmF
MAMAGRLAVWVALLAAVAAALSPVAGRRGGGPGRAVRLLALSAGAGVVATGVLVRALVVGDWSLVYVADFSRRGASAPYRAAALWGGMAGSLLWLAALVGVAGLVSVGRLDDRGRRDQVAAVTGAVVAVLVLLVVVFADPFATLSVPAIDGAGLTPILEHPAMLYHPPLLYLGLATLVGPFALTVAALIDGRLDDAWLATVRRWALLPWTLLAVGMVAGAHWAYVELGWGGYWAWDPVENTALLPWLAVTVLLHAVRGAGTDRPPISRVAVAGLACLPFTLALLGSLLTRSGATSSVHAFAESRAIGRALGVVVVAVVLAVAALLRRAARRARAASGDAVPRVHAGATAGIAGRATTARLVAAHLAVVGAALAVVLAGTLWPLVTDLRGGEGIAVAGTYFARFTGPLAGAALALLCLVPVAVGGPVRPGARTVMAAGACGAAGAVGLLAACSPGLDPGSAVLGAAAGACIATSSSAVVVALRRGSPVAATSQSPSPDSAAPAPATPPGSAPRADGATADGRGVREAVGGHVAHAAFGLLALGIAGTATGGSRMVAVRPGDSVTVLGHEVTYARVTVENGPVAGSSAVVADVTTGGQHVQPSLVAFPDRGVLLAETSLRSTPTVDVQVTLRTADDDGTAVLEVGVHPLQVLVWWGGLAVVAAGAHALWRSPRRPAPSSGEAAPAPGHAADQPAGRAPRPHLSRGGGPERAP